MDFMRWKTYPRQAELLVALGLSSLVSIGFFAVSAINNRTLADAFLVGNLLLAWLPLLAVGWLLSVLQSYPWLNWRPMILTALWLSLLPNSFYLVSDLIHLTNIATSNLLYESVMYESFIFNGLLLGYISIYLIHQQLRRRVSPRWAAGLIGLTFLVCSFAIYIGRDLRWSSWDILLNPAGVLFAISNPFIQPAGHGQAFTITLMFFVLIGSMYVIIRRLVKTIYHPLR